MMIGSMLLLSVVTKTVCLQSSGFEGLALKLYRNENRELLSELTSIPEVQLRRISASLRLSVNENPERAAALPFALAIAKVNTSRNLSRMRSVYVAFDQSRRTNGPSRAKLMNVVEYLSGSYYSVWVKTGNSLAIKYLWEMALDGGLAEGQADFAAKCLVGSPKLFLRTVVVQKGPKAIGFADVLSDQARTNPTGFKRLITLLKQNSKSSGVTGANARVILGYLSMSESAKRSLR